MGQFRKYLNKIAIENNELTLIQKLNESPVAVIDDWKGFETKELTIGKKGMQLDWALKDTIKDTISWLNKKGEK